VKKILRTFFILVFVQLMFVSVTYAAPAAGGEPGRGTPGNGGGGCDSYHTVQYGDTLYSIGRRYGVSPQQIVHLNSLANPDHVYVGQILHIPCGGDGGHGHKPYPGGGYFPAVGYGYDFTGYYYETYYPGYRRYSYTCGYHFNCY